MSDDAIDRDLEDDQAARRSAVKSPFQPGEMIAGKYRVERELGRGGMGIVLAALHVELDQRVAVKLLHPSAAENPDFVVRFSREARSAAKIRSEHVARMIDVGTLADGTAYFVMEYLEGEDLAEVLRRRGALPVPLAVDYVLQACEAVAAAHAAGIIHRDIKPANLFLARNPDRSTTLKVLDFGVAKVTRPGPTQGATDDARATTPTGNVVGSPMYMSPEQLRGHGSVDARADIWALGVVLHELLANAAPFAQGALAEIFASVMRDPPARLRDLVPDAPVEIEDVIIRCLEKQPGKRYANVAAMARALLPFGPARAADAVERMERLVGSADVTMDVAEAVACSRLGSRPNSHPSDSGRRSLPGSPEPAASDSISLSPPSTRDGYPPISLETRPLTRQATSGPRGRRRQPLLAGLVLSVGVGAIAILRGASAPAAGSSPAVAPLVTLAIPAAPPTLDPPGPSPSPPAPTRTDAGSALPVDIALSIAGVPAGTRVYRGVVLLGTAPGVIRLRRGPDSVTLRFAADGYTPAEVEIVPDADRLVTASLVRASIRVTRPSKPVRSSDLETF